VIGLIKLIHHLLVICYSPEVSWCVIAPQGRFFFWYYARLSSVLGRWGLGGRFLYRWARCLFLFQLMWVSSSAGCCRCWLLCCLFYYWAADCRYEIFVTSSSRVWWHLFLCGHSLGFTLLAFTYVSLDELLVFICQCAGHFVRAFCSLWLSYKYSKCTAKCKHVIQLCMGVSVLSRVTGYIAYMLYSCMACHACPWLLCSAK